MANEESTKKNWMFRAAMDDERKEAERGNTIWEMARVMEVSNKASGHWYGHVMSREYWDLVKETQVIGMNRSRSFRTAISALRKAE